MSELVKLPKEVAKSMKFFLEDCQFSQYAMMRIFLNGSKTEHCVDGACLEDYAVENYEGLLKALVNGYEVELSKEDKVREVIMSYCNATVVSDWVIRDIKAIYEGENN
jgi:hypothetical protein